MILLLAKMLGVRRLTGWALRLAQVAFWLFLVGGAATALVLSKDVQKAAIVIVVVGLCLAVFWAVASHSRRGQEETGPRTIDGKIVPEILAAAALGVPAQSPDGDYVLRGLPDYGKMLLKLDAAEFEYRPEVVPDKLPELPEPEPEETRPWFATVPRWAWVSGVAALLVVGVVFMTQGREQHPARSEWQPVAAAGIQQESAPAPLPVPAPVPSPAPIAEAAPAPAPEPLTSPTETRPASDPVPDATRPSASTLGSVALEAISNTPPVYPRSARLAHISGTVVLQATIGKTGRVMNLSVISGPEKLQQAALYAVSGWTYKPYLVNGEPSDVDITIRVNFRQ